MMRHPLANRDVFEIPLDLVQQMEFEDLPDLFISLEEAGLSEEREIPLFGFQDSNNYGVHDYVAWWADEDSDSDLESMLH